MDLKAIIFDMDGVIVDTEYYDFQLQKNFIEKSNPDIRIEDAELLQIVGTSYDRLYGLLQKFIGKQFTLEEIEKEYLAFSTEHYKNLDYQKLFRKDIKLIIQFAKANNIKLAVASSSMYQHIREVLENCTIFQIFDVIESGENFKESKPNPEIYYSVLEKLSLSAENCIAIEDSYSGIEASTTAGIPTIGYYDSRLPRFNAKANWRVENMRQVYDIITNL
ncbi:HAD family hydrolase [Streptococcus sp. 10F2]